MRRGLFRPKNLRDDTDDQADFNPVGQSSLSVLGRDGLGERDHSDDHQDANENVADLRPDLLEKRDLLLLCQHVRAVALEAALGLRRGESVLRDGLRDANLIEHFLVGHGMIGSFLDLLRGGFEFWFLAHAADCEIKALRAIEKVES